MSPFTQVQNTQFTIAKRRKQTQCPSIDGETNCGGTHVGSDGEKKDETLTPAASIDRERIMLGAIGQTQKDQRCDFTYMRYPE